MAVAAVFAFATTPASAELRVNVNFDYTVFNRTNLVGPAGGAGETWNQTMGGTHGAAGGFYSTTNNILDSAGIGTGIGWSFKRSDDGALFRWVGDDSAALSMLQHGIFTNSSINHILSITGLDSTRKYDLYIASYANSGGTYLGSSQTHSTTNTTTTVGSQSNLISGNSATWAPNDNYVAFEDMVPDGLGKLTINISKLSSYGFWSGFQLVESLPRLFRITSFTSTGGGSWELALNGEPNTAYKLVEAADLDFTSPDQNPIPLTGATVGTLVPGGITTSSTGDAKVQFNLGITKASTFLRAELLPKEPTGANLDLLTAVRSGFPRKVVIMGTSLSTVAYGNWPGLMTPWLKSQAPDPNKVTVVNLAISGSNSQTGGINQLANIKAQNPDTVFMEFSMNDAYTPYNISLQQSAANHNFIIDDLRADNPDVEIIIQTMNNPTNSHLTIRPNIVNYYQVARDVATARNLRIIDHYPNWIALYTTAPGTWSTYVPDGIHPTQTGYQNVMIPKLQQALENQ